jgi:hypothetical protein
MALHARVDTEEWGDSIWKREADNDGIERMRQRSHGGQEKSGDKRERTRIHYGKRK